MKRIISILKVAGPWAVAVGIMAYLFHLYPISSVLNAAKLMNIIGFSAFALFYFLFIFAIDTWVFSRVLTRFHHPVSFKELLPARAVTYLIMILNYGASQGAFAYYLKRTKQVAIFEVLGTFAFIALIDLYWLIGLAVTGSYFGNFYIDGIRFPSLIRKIFDISWTSYFEVQSAPLVRTIGVVALILLVAHLLFWKYCAGNKWLRKRKIFHIFHEARLRDYAAIALMRTPIHACIIVSMYVVLLTFNSHVPFVTIIGATPIAFILGVLPISPSGLGVTNWALMKLLGPFLSSPLIDGGVVTAPAIILAASLLWVFANMALKAIVGALYLLRVSKDLFRPS